MPEIDISLSSMDEGELPEIAFDLPFDLIESGFEAELPDISIDGAVDVPELDISIGPIIQGLPSDLTGLPAENPLTGGDILIPDASGIPAGPSQEDIQKVIQDAMEKAMRDAMK